MSVTSSHHHSKTYKTHKLSEFYEFSKLKTWIEKNITSPDGQLQAKARIYQAALARFEASKQDSSYKAIQLNNLNDFRLSTNEKPKYFKNIFNYRGSKISCTTHPNFYTYQNTDKLAHYWVDFAASHFGGGAFGRGFVQEEQMLGCFPELANHALNCSDKDKPHSNLQIRLGSIKVQQGSPTPVVFKGVTRTQNIEKIYGREIDSQNKNTIDPFLTDVKIQKVNILAIAAPLLDDAKNSANLDTIEDLFNTAIAGFASAKSSRWDQSKRVVIHSGKLGCGAFNNNPRVAYVLQKLAATHLDVDIELFGYKDDEAAESEKDYADVMTTFNQDKDKSISNLLKITSQIMQEKLRQSQKTLFIDEAENWIQAHSDYPKETPECLRKYHALRSFLFDPNLKKLTPSEASEVAINWENTFGVAWLKSGTRFANNNGDILLGENWKSIVNELRHKHWIDTQVK